MNNVIFLKRIALITLCIFSVTLEPDYFTSESMSLTATAEARPPNGGFRGPANKSSRPMARPRPMTRPSVRPRPRPITRPSVRPRPTTRPSPSLRPRPTVRPQTRPSVRPNRPIQRPRPNRPSKPIVITRPTPGLNRPQLVKPQRPNKPYTNAPDTSRPDFIKPLRPVKPNRPPWWRPPSWRPPYWAPPYHRPPHWHWGTHYWHNRWGWYYTDFLVDRTVVFIDRRPSGCEKTTFEGEDLLFCEGILYRPSYHKDNRIYEIVDPEDNSSTSTDTSSTETIQVLEGTVLKLQIPRMVGSYVNRVQTALRNYGHIIDDRDGIFGTGTSLALKEFQSRNQLSPTGELDSQSAQKLGL